MWFTTIKNNFFKKKKETQRRDHPVFYLWILSDLHRVTGITAKILGASQKRKRMGRTQIFDDDF